MLDYPKRPEGTTEQQVERLFDLLWKIIEEINNLEERLHDQS